MKYPDRNMRDSLKGKNKLNNTKSTCRVWRVGLIIIFLSCSMGFVYGQSYSRPIKFETQLEDSTNNDLTYYEVDEEDLNPALDASISGIIQGKVPGLSLYKRGDDPNGLYTYRLRGTSSFERNRPLIVVDGMIHTSADVIDPFDIKSIKVLKEIDATSAYGYLGSSGVIEITTKTGDYNLGNGKAHFFNIEYSGYMALSENSRRISSLNGQEYLAAGGINLGDDTDWQELVSRTGVSRANKIAISGGNANTRYRLSGNIKNLEGILRHSGFEQINGRASINHSLLDDRLELILNMSSAKRESNFSFSEAFRYAAVYNPTSPVRHASGGFFQPILFDNFNPLAILELNTNEGEAKNFNYNVQTGFNLHKEFRISAKFGQQFTSASYGEFYPSNSFFRGLNRGGLARRSFTDGKFTLFETRGMYSSNLKKNIQLTTIVGYSYKEFFREGLTLELGNLPSNDLGFYAIDLSGDRVLGNANNVFVDSYATPEEKIIAMFSRFNLSYDDKIFINASLRREGSTKLGTNNKWGLFPTVSVGANVAGFWETDILSRLKVHLTYGETGTLPNQSGLSQDRYEYSFINGGTVSKVQQANPDLKWEDKREVSLGIDYSLMNDRFTGILNFYRVNISDFILEVNDPMLQSSQYQNFGELETNGWEFSLNYSLLRESDIQWNTGLILSSYKSKMNKFGLKEAVFGSPGALGQGSTSMVRVAEGEEIGQIWGTLFSGQVDENGYPIMVDVNNDGQLVTDYGSSLDEDGDFTKLGNAIPDLELGWSSTLGYKNWKFYTSFRGAFGHSLVNLNRMFYEPIDIGSLVSYNRVITDKAVEGLTVSRFSSLYVEKADFLTLDYLAVSYLFNLDAIAAISDLSTYFAIENAFTITGYTGLSPEPVLEDLGPVDNGSKISGERDLLVMGIDRRLNYLPARSFIFGIRVTF